ncbi:hypothetical protein GCM10010182_19430 [Actinomadura cremea]|nr:hypothetical protein GCM10010182_19430 [Actinomadura cremea]
MCHTPLDARNSVSFSEIPGRIPTLRRDGAKAADRSAEFRLAISIGMASLDPHRPLNPSDSIWMRPVYDSLLPPANGAGGVEIAPSRPPPTRSRGTACTGGGTATGTATPPSRRS